MNCCGGSSRHTRRVSLGLCSSLRMVIASSCFFSTLFRGYNFLWEECPLFSSRFPILHMCPGRLITSICMRVLIGPFTPTSFFLPASFHSNHLFPVSNQPCAHNHSFSLSYLLSCHFVSHCLSGPDCAIGMLTSDRSTSAPDVCFPLTSSWGPQ